MTTPITNNNAQDLLRGAGSSALAGNNKVLRPDSQGVGAGNGQPVPETIEDGQQQEEGVTLSRAAQVLSQPPKERGEGVIQSADHASQVAKGLRALFEGNSGQALAAQARNISPDLMGLLKAG